MLEQIDLKNLLALIAIAPIKGQEAITVAMLQQKLTSMLTPEVPVETPTPENETQK